MKKIIAALLATIAFATALTGCGGNKNNSKNETSAHSSATSENEDSKSDDKNKVESKADSMTDDAERNGRVRDGDGIIGNEEYENRDDGLTDDVEDYVEGRMENGSTLADDAIF